MAGLLAYIGLAWAASLLLLAVLLIGDDLRERRSQRSQTFPGWVSAPDAAHLLVEPADAQVIDLDSHRHHAKAEW